MRESFIKAVEQKALDNSKLIFITADVGYSVVEDVEKVLKDRFINVGIAEADMMGIASGLALCQKKVITYSFASFVVLRAFEQIRIDIAYQNLDVKIVGVGGGLTYPKAGVTHHAIEDISLMRSLPNMTVLCPCDPYEARVLTQQAIDMKGPVYIRLAKKGEPRILRDDSDINIGKAIVLEEGQAVAIISTGNMVETALKAADILKGKGISAYVIDMHTIKPIDEKLISSLANKCSNIFTLEEHNVIGGLGSAVCEFVAGMPSNKCRVKRLGIEDSFIKVCGSQEYLRKQLGLDPKSISEKILKILE